MQSLQLPSCSHLHELLEKRLQTPEKKDKIDQMIIKDYEKTCAIFVLDMSGFSSVVQRYGIIHFLAMVQRMRSVVRPAIEKYAGRVIKFEADNCFAVFSEVDDAIRAEQIIRRELQRLNDETPDESDVHVSIGIGYGDVLLFCDDLYGDQLNLASKLGEDVAEKNETLLTQEAFHACKQQPATSLLPVTISGITIQSYRLMM